jgi:hypothetical protein
LVGVLVILIFVFAITLLLGWIDEGSEAKYLRLQTGMSVSQVVAVFGRPSTRSAIHNEVTVMAWDCDDGDITVLFNSDNKATMTFLTQKEASHRTLKDMLLAVLSKVGL